MTIEATLQSIDGSLISIAAALEKLANVKDETPAPKKAKGKSGKAAATEASSSSKSKSTSEPAEKPSEVEDTPTVTAVRRALGSVQKAFDQDTAREILKDVGGANIMSKVPKANYAAIIAAAEKKVADAK